MENNRENGRLEKKNRPLALKVRKLSDAVGKLDKTLVLLISILLLGALLRFWGLTFQSLWYDELCSVIRAAPTHSVGEIIDIYQVDPHPPFHPLLLHYWMSIFGYHEAAARLLSALAGLAGIFAIFLLGRAVAGKQGGVISAAIVAFNFYHVYHSQEVRPYIFAFLFSALSFLFFLKLLNVQSKKNVLLYAIFSTLLIYTHYYGLIMLVAQGISLVFYAVIEESCDKRRLFVHYGLSGIVILVLYSPWIPTVLKMLQRKKHWAKPPNDSFFIQYFREYFGGNSYLVFLVTFVLLCLFLYLFLRAQGTRGKDSAVETGATSALIMEKAVPVFLFTIFFSLFIPYVRSRLVVSFLDIRYTIVTFALYIPLIAAGITLFRGKLFKSFIIVTLILVSLFNILGEKRIYSRVLKQQWREVTGEVIANHPMESPCVYVSKKCVHFQFYFTMNKSDITVLCSQNKGIKKILEKSFQNRVNICLLSSNGGIPDKAFMKVLKKHFVPYKEIKYHGLIAEYYRAKQ